MRIDVLRVAPTPNPPPIKKVIIELTTREAMILVDLMGRIGGYGNSKDGLTIEPSISFTDAEVRDELTSPIFNRLDDENLQEY